MKIRSLTRALGASLALACLAAAPAHATLATDYAYGPTAAQAGGHPDVNFDLAFGSVDGDDVRDVTISLPPGLVANPRVAAKCTVAALEADSCSNDAAVGTGDVTASAWFFTITSSATLYLVQPTGDEIVRLGLVVNTPLGHVVLHAPVQVKTTPSLHLEIPFKNLPRSIGGISITISEIKLGLAGTVNNRAFTRLPSTCVAAPSTMSAVSYDDPTKTITKTSTFTPAGCDILAYYPEAKATAAIDAGHGVAFTTAITQNPGHAASKTLALALPDGLVVRPSVLAQACNAADPTTCPESSTVGQASLETPLLGSPIKARIVLVQKGDGLPGIAILVPAPFTMEIDGQTGLTPDGLITMTFDGLPDLPLNEIDVALNGGATSLLMAERELCRGEKTLAMSFLGHSGREADIDAPLTPTGCDQFPTVPSVDPPAPDTGGSTGGTTGGSSPSAAAPSGPAPSGTSGASGGSTPSAKDLTTTVSLRGLKGKSPRISTTVRAAGETPGLTKVSVCLPTGISFLKSKLRGDSLFVVANGKRLTSSAVKTTSSRCVEISRPGIGARGITVTLSGPALKVSASVKKALKKPLSLALTVTDAAGHTTTLRPAAKAA